MRAASGWRSPPAQLRKVRIGTPTCRAVLEMSPALDARAARQAARSSSEYRRGAMPSPVLRPA